jgi:uncharacterized protein YutE (UPF0331/DUF86 family)
MVFKKKVISERLTKLDEAISILRKHQSVKWEKYEGDIELQWIVERGFILTAEMIFDIGAHILASEFSIYPDEYEDIIKQLGAKGVISQNLTEGLKGFAGFRNILVHEYINIDQKIIYNALKEDVNLLTEFLKSLSLWIKDFA